MVAWLGRVPEPQLYLSVLVLGEILKGIAKLADLAQRERLETWLEGELTPRFAGRVLGIDVATATRWGVLSGEAEARGEPAPVIDALLAATALEHGLTLVTRNTQDYQALGVRLLNPWEEV